MRKIIFVDDEPNVISGLRRQLKNLLPNCEMLGANNGREALRLLEDSDIDTIVLDIRMPDINGLEVLAILKTRTNLMHIPVIMLTGCTERDLKLRALNLGAHDFVNKPADPYELAARIRGAMRVKLYEYQLRDQNIILEQQLFQSQKMEIIGLLASSVAHDLNNILTAISGNTELAAIKTIGNTGAAANLNVALKSCAHGTKLVQQILRLGRRSKSQSELHDLRDVIDESLMLLSVIIPNEIKVVWTKPDKAFNVSADQTQMIQVFMNLITNSVHAMNGSGVITIKLETISQVDDSIIQSEDLASGRYHKICVIDTGTGMDKSTKDQIFDSFFTTKEKGKGTGIGLSVVNRIIKKYFGQINVESEIGVGTTFCVYLPDACSIAKMGNQKEREESVERKKTNSVC